MKTVTLFLLFLSANTFAQLYVGNGYDVYVKNEVVFVKQDLELQSGSNLYLRNEAQFLQGTASTSANKGAGQFSVFQEGNSNNYAFNYWCSPVGNASVSSGNENFGITQLARPTSATASTAASTLANDADGTANPLAISTYWIYKYLASGTFADWVYVGSAATISAGQGFTMKGTSGTDATVAEGNSVQNNPGSAQRYDFRGKPNDGNITVVVAPNNFTLTGNPYPSALNVNAFLLDAGNTACTANAYYWEQDKTVNSHNLQSYKGGYGTYSPVSLGSSGVYVPATFNTYNLDGSLNTTGSSSGLNNIERKYAPIGQGFMIQGAASGSSVTIKNSHRVYYKESTTANSYFSRTASQENAGQSVLDPQEENTVVSHLKINASINNQFTRQLALAFVPGATDGVERGIEGKSPDGDDLPNDAFFLIDNERYVIEGVEFNIDKRINLGVKVTGDTTFNFSLLEAVNFDENQQVYIYDALDNSYHDIKLSDYNVTLAAGTYNERFQVTFTDAALGVGNLSDTGISVIQSNTEQKLKIANPDALDIQSVILYDVTGKQLINRRGLGTKDLFEFPTAGFSEGVYFVSILDANNRRFTRKIAIGK